MAAEIRTLSRNVWSGLPRRNDPPRSRQNRARSRTEAWTREGKRARRQLKQFLAELRGLGSASGQQCVIDGMDKVRLFILGNVMRPEGLPNWDGAGGLN